MMIAAFLTLALQQSAHANLHPGDAAAFLEAPDVQAVLAAYPTAPMPRMFADETALAALRRLLGQPELTGASLVDRAFRLVGADDLSLDVVSQVTAASLSVGGSRAEGDLFALAVVDTQSESVAKLLADALASEDRWVEQAGARVIAGAGAMTSERWHTLAGGPAGGIGLTIEAEQLLSADANLLPKPEGPVLFRGLQRENSIAVLAEIVGPEVEQLQPVWEMLVGGGRTHFQMSLANGRFVTQSWAPGKAAPIDDAPWLAPAPVNPALLDEVHPDCMIVAATSFDRAGLRGALTDALGVDLAGAPVFDKLGSNAVLFLQPIRGIGLPKGFLVVELEQSEGVLEDLVAMFPRGGEVEADDRKYKKLPYVTLSLPPEVSSLGDLGTLRPVIAVFDDKLFVTNGTLAMKAEIRRRLGDEREQHGPADYPWTRGEAVLGEDATALVYVDWAQQIEGVLSLARSFGGILEGGMGADLPFDLSNLPEGSTFTRFLSPTVHVVRDVAGGTFQHHEAAFAFETWAGLAGFAHILLAEVEVPLAEPDPSRPIAGGAGGAGRPVQTEEDKTRWTLDTLRTGLTVYKIDQGSYPAQLEALLTPTANYPQGFLDGRTALEPDAWGRAIRYELAEDGASYRLWSLGADGVDQDGAGDDVRAR